MLFVKGMITQVNISGVDPSGSRESAVHSYLQHVLRMQHINFGHIHGRGQCMQSKSQQSENIGLQHTGCVRTM